MKITFNNSINIDLDDWTDTEVFSIYCNEINAKVMKDKNLSKRFKDKIVSGKCNITSEDGMNIFYLEDERYSVMPYSKWVKQRNRNNKLNILLDDNS